MEVEEEVVGPKGPDLKLASRRDMYSICQNAGLGRDSPPSLQKSRRCRPLSLFTLIAVSLLLLPFPSPIRRPGQEVRSDSGAVWRESPRQLPAP